MYLKMLKTFSFQQKKPQTPESGMHRVLLECLDFTFTGLGKFTNFGFLFRPIGTQTLHNSTHFPQNVPVKKI